MRQKKILVEYKFTGGDQLKGGYYKMFDTREEAAKDVANQCIVNYLPGDENNDTDLRVRSEGKKFSKIASEIMREFMETSTFTCTGVEGVSNCKDTFKIIDNDAEYIDNYMWIKISIDGVEHRGWVDRAIMEEKSLSDTEDEISYPLYTEKDQFVVKGEGVFVRIQNGGKTIDHLLFPSKSIGIEWMATNVAQFNPKKPFKKCFNDGITYQLFKDLSLSKSIHEDMTESNELFVFETYTESDADC